MSITQPTVFTAPLVGASPPSTAPLVVGASDAVAGFDARWAAWQADGRAQTVARRQRLRTAGLVFVITAALAGIMRLSFGWFQ